MASKQPKNAQRPFPWRCPECAAMAVVPSQIDYPAEVRHDGRFHAFTVTNLRIPACESCGAKVFTEEVDDQINAVLRKHLNLLTPEQIRTGLARVGTSQKEVAERLGIAEATMSRWLNETQIQSRSLDRLLRIYFAFPQVRAALPPNGVDTALGTADRGEVTP